MFQALKKYFSITNRELNGMIVLLVIMLVIFIIPFILAKVNYNPNQITVQEIEPVINQIEFRSKEVKSKEIRNNIKFKKPENISFFDPNTLNIEQWMNLGLSEKQAKPIINYIAKGGRFYKVEDLKKMFTINDFIYGKIAPFVKIQSKTKSEEFKENAKPNVLKVIELNTADSLTLIKLNGVGPYFASRIIKYRKKIGGFHSTSQLLEVYGIDSIKFNQIKNNLVTDENFITKISINGDNFNDLKKIPYLNYKQINAILSFRGQHGNFTNLNDLESIKIINKDILEKIKPYVKL